MKELEHSEQLLRELHDEHYGLHGKQVLLKE